MYCLNQLSSSLTEIFSAWLTDFFPTPNAAWIGSGSLLTVYPVVRWALLSWWPQLPLFVATHAHVATTSSPHNSLRTTLSVSCYHTIPWVIISRPPVLGDISLFCLCQSIVLLSLSHPLSFQSCMANFLGRVGWCVFFFFFLYFIIAQSSETGLRFRCLFVPDRHYCGKTFVIIFICLSQLIYHTLKEDVPKPT